MRAYLWLAIAICAEIVATNALARTRGLSRLAPLLVAGPGYLLSFFFFALAIKTLPTGMAYAIWSGVGIVVIAATAWWFQGQVLDWPAIAGIGFILIGVLLMNLFSRSVVR